MPSIYKYEVKIDADHSYTGELELTSSGFIGLTMDQALEPMVGETEHSVNEIFKSAGQLFVAHGSLEKIEITKIEV